MLRTYALRRLGLVTGAVITCVALGAGSAQATIATVGSDGAGDSYYPADGNGGYDVSDYNVSIGYDPVSKHLDGDTTVTARATQFLKRFNLDLYGLTVRSVEVNGKPAKFARSGDHELEITPSRTLFWGEKFAVRVRYDGIPKTIQSSLGLGGWQISSSGGAFAAGQPHAATAWYPANDHPRDKATFHLAAKVPAGWSAISNGQELGSTTADGWTTYRWSEETPIITYLTTVAIDKWTIQRSKLADGTPVVSAFAPGAEDKKVLEDRLPEILDFLSSKFGRYPLDAAGGIYLADSIGFSLETQTRPTYSRRIGLSTVVHEQAHQWFGDSVSIDRWRDICLNECFASYASWMWSEAKDGKVLDDSYRAAVAANRDKPAYWAGRLYDMGPGKEFTAVYSKGQLALHALRRQIGERAFDRLLKGWTALNRNGTVSWPEFEKFTQLVAGQRLGGFFDAWFRGDKLPEDKYLWPGSLHP